MRRHSSHLVFFVMLLCSVQVSEGFALQLADGAITRRAIGASQRRVAALAVRPIVAREGSASHVAVTTSLNPAARTAHRTVWIMRRPARAAAAVNNHTSLLRA